VTGFRVLLAVGTAAAVAAVAAGAASASLGPLKPRIGEVVAFDTTPPLRDLPTVVLDEAASPAAFGERGAGSPKDNGHQPDGALQKAAVTNTIQPPLFTFEGPSNADNIRIFAPRFPNGVNPPDPVGDVGRNHYVAMVNLTFAIYTKQGQLLFGPADTGTLWQDFPVDECTEPSGDPIVVYDELSDRWILTQFTTRGIASVPPAPPVPPNPFYNCVAISATKDPLGPYHRYAFVTPGTNFPDYPKYGVMGDGLYITTREFANQGTAPESIGIYAIDRKAIVKGDPSPTVVSFQLAGPAYLRGDGILPADFDGRKHPPPHSPEYFMGTMDTEFPDGAPFDGINWFEASIDFKNPANSTFALTKQIPIANFDTIFPCVGPLGSRDCIPQPLVDPTRYLDILSYRQRPTWRLQYRNFGQYEALVTNQSVEARPGIAGVRWWEIRNPRDPVIYQEGTWAPPDGVHRWMGSVAMDRDGNLAVGYSVSNASLFPGIRYAGRLRDDPLGELSLGEASLQEGSGVNMTQNSRWGDYTSMNVDPGDDCTFYYINEYMTQIGPLAPWRTRIGAFKLPGCK
jgi:hypothetical protein